MKWFEKFGFYTGIIGLVTNVITLALFFSDSFQQSSSQVNGELPKLLLILLGMFLLYSWVALSWVMTRKSFLLRTGLTKPSVYQLASRSTTSLGILILPIAIGWAFSLLSSPNDGNLWLLGFILIYFIIGFLIFLLIGLLTPLIYPDMPLEESFDRMIGKLSRRFLPLKDLSSDKKEKED